MIETLIVGRNHLYYKLLIIESEEKPRKKKGFYKHSGNKSHHKMRLVQFFKALSNYEKCFKLNKSFEKFQLIGKHFGEIFLFNYYLTC